MNDCHSFTVSDPCHTESDSSAYDKAIPTLPNPALVLQPGMSVSDTNSIPPQMWFMLAVPVLGLHLPV